MFREPDIQNDPGPTPSWWALYAIGGVLVGLIAIVELTVPAGNTRTVCDVLVVLLVVRLFRMWIRHNRVAIELGRWQHRR